MHTQADRKRVRATDRQRIKETMGDGEDGEDFADTMPLRYVTVHDSTPDTRAIGTRAKNSCE